MSKGKLVMCEVSLDDKKTQIEIDQITLSMTLEKRKVNSGMALAAAALLSAFFGGAQYFGEWEKAHEFTMTQELIAVVNNLNSGDANKERDAAHQLKGFSRSAVPFLVGHFDNSHEEYVQQTLVDTLKFIMDEAGKDNETYIVAELTKAAERVLQRELGKPAGEPDEYTLERHARALAEIGSGKFTVWNSKGKIKKMLKTYEEEIRNSSKITDPSRKEDLINFIKKQAGKVK